MSEEIFLEYIQNYDTVFNDSLNSKDDIVDFLPEEYPVMKNFTLLDHFYNEAAAGFYLDQPEAEKFHCFIQVLIYREDIQI